MSHDEIISPAHYAFAEVECIDAIRAQMSKEELAGYYRGNVVKYLWRYKTKGGLQDLKKAKVYLEWLIQHESTGD
jgi:hypothetical protein